MDVTTLTLERLESLAYKQICQLNLAEKNLNVIEREIEKRMAQPVPAESAIELPPINPE